MIVKVQRSLYSSDGKDTVLIYNKTWSVTETRALTKELALKMNGSYKCYFHAQMRNGRLEIGEVAQPQDW